MTVTSFHGQPDFNQQLHLPLAESHATNYLFLLNSTAGRCILENVDEDMQTDSNIPPLTTIGGYQYNGSSAPNSKPEKRRVK